MATKKASKKTAKKSSPSIQALRERPFADSSAPEHCRVDLCTADAEWMRTLYPDSPQPVFSSLSCMHGMNSRGAKRIRPGFAFTPSMDLVWALGFPNLAFIVDGVPVPDTFAATLELYNPRKASHRNWGAAQAEHGRLYTRRAAIARLYELAPFPEGTPKEEEDDWARDVFELEAEDAETYTASREITDFRLRTALVRSAIAYGGAYAEDVPLLSAWLGPDRVAEMLVQLIEEANTEIRLSSLAFGLELVSLSLTEQKHAELAQRARTWWEQNRDAKEADYLRWIFDAPAVAAEHRESKTSLGFYRATTLGAPEEQLRQDAKQNCRINSSDPFLDDPHEILKRITETWNVWADIDEHFLGAHSSITSPEVLPNLLRLLATESTSAKAEAWFLARREWAAPHLDALSGGSDAKLAKLARKAASLKAE